MPRSSERHLHDEGSDDAEALDDDSINLPSSAVPALGSLQDEPADDDLQAMAAVIEQ